MYSVMHLAFSMMSFSSRTNIFAHSGTILATFLFLSLSLFLSCWTLQMWDLNSHSLVVSSCFSHIIPYRASENKCCSCCLKDHQCLVASWDQWLFSLSLWFFFSPVLAPDHTAMVLGTVILCLSCSIFCYKCSYKRWKEIREGLWSHTVWGKDIL